MHPKVKACAKEYPMYRYFFVNVNNAIRCGVREIDANDLLRLVTGSPYTVNFIDFSYLLTELNNQGVLDKWIEICALDTDEVLKVCKGIPDAVVEGRAIIPNKTIDYTEFVDDESEFAYMNVVYQLVDLYGEDNG